MSKPEEIEKYSRMLSEQELSNLFSPGLMRQINGLEHGEGSISHRAYALARLAHSHLARKLDLNG